MSTLDLVCLGAVTLAAAYWSAAMLSVVTFGRRRVSAAPGSAPVSVLKPLRGDDGELYENLRSFCRQDYPRFEIVFGVRDREDPAVAVVERLIREFPRVEARLVIEGRAIGSNRKVSNLAHLLRRARHDVVVVADSDMRVDRTYLGAVVAPLDDPTVGLVTCLYRGVARRGLASRLAAMFINEWFLPAALVGTHVERLRHAFGATIACRRATLEAIGGFEAIADYLADDYMLGRRVTDLGLRVTIAPYVVDNVVTERNMTTLFFHELRWARTFRTLRPLPYLCSLITYGIPVSLIWLAVGGAGGLAALATLLHLALRCAGRVLLYSSLGRRVSWSEAWLVPIRDVISFTLGILSFFGTTVRWNDETLRVRLDGRLERDEPARGVERGHRAAEPRPLASKWEESP